MVYMSSHAGIGILALCIPVLDIRLLHAGGGIRFLHAIRLLQAVGMLRLAEDW
jgi:hypothetical protein